jgi:hypothetical protein
MISTLHPLRSVGHFTAVDENEGDELAARLIASRRPAPR